MPHELIILSRGTAFRSTSQGGSFRGLWSPRSLRPRWCCTKTRRKKMHAIETPIVPELAAIIAASPTGDLTFLTTG